MQEVHVDAGYVDRLDKTAIMSMKFVNSKEVVEQRVVDIASL